MTHEAPSFFALRGLRAGLFGESYVLISVSKPTEFLWSAEYHILTSVPAEAVSSDIVSFDTTDYPAGLPPIDKDYMVEEALLQADRDISIELQKRTTALGNVEIDPPQFRLERSDLTLVSLWTRRIFHEALAEIVKTSQDSELKRYVAAVMTIKGFRKPST